MVSCPCTIFTLILMLFTFFCGFHAKLEVVCTFDCSGCEFHSLRSELPIICLRYYVTLFFLVSSIPWQYVAPFIPPTMPGMRGATGGRQPAAVKPALYLIYDIVVVK